MPTNVNYVFTYSIYISFVDETFVTNKLSNNPFEVSGAEGNVNLMT